MDLQEVFRSATHEVANGDVIFRTHADIPFRLEKLLEDPDCSIAQVTALLAAEPFLAARAMALANSIAFNPLGRVVDNMQGAVARLGFANLRAMAISFVVKQIAVGAGNAKQQSMAARLWEHSASVAALARVLAKRVTGQPPDTAFFAGIVHEIGGFFLISKLSEHPTLTEGEFDHWRGENEADIGRALVASLGLPEAIVEALEVLWAGYLTMPAVSLGDTLLLADELTSIESPWSQFDGSGCKGLHADLEMQIGNALLTEIIAESASEVEALKRVLI